jgi:hypothetical protein
MSSIRSHTKHFPLQAQEYRITSPYSIYNLFHDVKTLNQHAGKEKVKKGRAMIHPWPFNILYSIIKAIFLHRKKTIHKVHLSM